MGDVKDLATPFMKYLNKEKVYVMCHMHRLA